MPRVKTIHHSRAGKHGMLRRVEAHGMRMARGGNKHWFYVGTGLWTLRTVRRMAERREEVLVSEVLRPGQRIVIANDRATIEGPADAVRAPKGRRGRKKQRKADNKQLKAEKRAARKRPKKAPSDRSDVG